MTKEEIKDANIIEDKSIKAKKKKNSFNSITKKMKGFIVRFIKKIQSNKNVLKYVVGGIILLLVVISLGKLIFKNNDINYPVVFNTSEGDLLLLNGESKKNEEATKLAVGESVSNVLYANTSDRYVLFKKGSDLYLYDAKSNEETTKIVENVKTYKFSLNDKYIVTLDNDDNLNVYNYKSNNKLESDISEIIDVTEDKVLFEKDSVIYVRSLNYKKDDRVKVTAEYGSYIQFTDNGKYVYYINKENNLIAYNTKNNKENKIASKVKNYYCSEESCEKMFYLVDDSVKTIYYYDGKKETKVAEGVYSLYTADIEHRQVIYATVEDGKYTLHYQTVGKDALEIENNLTSIRTIKIFEGKEIYYITGKNEVKYVKINGSKVDKPKSLGAGVTGYLYLYKDGYAFVSDVDSNSRGTLYIARDGKAKKIDTDINSSLITVNKKGNRIYYFKDYDVTGTLYVTSGSKNTKLDENVYTFAYINDDLLYYIKDYSRDKARGDLFIYRKGKTTRIKENVSRIASSPVSYNK